MSTQIVYAVETPPSGGQSAITVTANMSQPAATTVSPGVFRDEQFLQFWGLRASSDSVATGVGSMLVRSITLQMDASSLASGVVVRQPGAPQGKLISSAVTVQGLDYIRPPLPVVTDPTGKGAVLSAGLQMQAVAATNIVQTGWTAAATAVAVGGGLAPGGVPALLAVTVFAGAISAIVVTNPTTNGPYNYPPTVVLTDPGNPTAAAQFANLFGRMAVFPTLNIIQPGDNYTNPTLSFTPFFKTMCPDTNPTMQGAAVRGWMQGVLAAAVGSPFAELAPVVT